MYMLQAGTHFSSFVFCTLCYIVHMVHHVMPLHFTHTCTKTHEHTPLLTNDFLIPEQYPLCEPAVRRRGG